MSAQFLPPASPTTSCTASAAPSVGVDGPAAHADTGTILFGWDFGGGLAGRLEV